MGQLSTFFIFVALLFTLPTGAQASEPEHSDDSFYESKQNTRVLGRNLGASISTGTPAGSTSLQSNTVLTILGDSLHALTGNIDIPNTPDAG